MPQGSQHHQHQGAAPSLGAGMPQLRLPTFALRQSPAPAPTAAPAPAQQQRQRQRQHHAAPAPQQYSHAPQYHQAPAPVHYQQAPQSPVYYAPAQPHQNHAYAVHQQHNAPMRPLQSEQQFRPASTPPPHVQPMAHRQPAPAMRTMVAPRSAFAGAQAGSTFSMSQPDSKVTPLHMGILLTLLVVAFLIAQGSPGSFSVATTPASLPAAVTPTSQQTLPLKPDAAVAGNISPAAAASVTAERTGKVSGRDTANIRLGGIPSPAAAATLAPQTLPLARVDDGMSLPRSAGERDGYAVERHYGSGTLPLEREVQTPAVTPGQAAQQAENHANSALVGVGDDSYAATPALANTAY